MDISTILLKLAEELASKSVYDDYLNQVEALKGESIRVGVFGQPCTGKTSLINALLGTNLPVSTLPSERNYHIRYSESATNAISSGDQSISLNSVWLRDKKAEIMEVNADIIPDQTSQIDICKIISQFDVCIFLTNAQAALNRADLFVLQNLNDVGVPALVVLSRMDLLNDEDQNTIVSYLKNHLNGLYKVSVLQLSKAISSSSTEIVDAINLLLSQANVNQSRSNFKNFYMGMAISKLFEICQNHIDESKAKNEAIEKSASNKIAELNSRTIDWLKLETQLRMKTSEITDKLRSVLAKRKDDIIRRLNHDVDVCGDVKLFWEKDLPFRFEEIMRIELNSTTQMVNTELMRTLQWLQDTLLKQFRCKMSLTTSIVSDNSTVITTDGTDVSVADTQKLKIVTRIGTAATVIAAGTLLASAGIGGIIMAISMVSGIGAEFFMRKQSSESKEKIKQVIPDIVNRSQLQIISDFNQKIEEVTSEIIAQLQAMKLDWIEQREKSIAQEKSIAIFNNNPSKWESLMQRINQLAVLILK